MARSQRIGRRGLLAAVLAAPAGAALAKSPPRGRAWSATADVVVVGSGAAGLPAAIAAREAGASVILIEREPDIGGHAICSGGNVPLGGGTSRQKKYGVEDSVDLLFRDLTDWSVTEPNGAADYRYNDREIVRAFAEANPGAYDWLERHGVVFIDRKPDGLGGEAVGNSAPRENHAAAMHWPLVQTGRPAPADKQASTGTGNGLMRPLEAAARKAGVDIRLEHAMTRLVREHPQDGRVLGVEGRSRGRAFAIRARKAVILATGGSSSNVEFRRMFDPRLTEEYCGVAGEPWSVQDASGELAAMAVGASLWGLANQTGEFGFRLTKPGLIGTRYGYVHLHWEPGSRVFDKAGARGLPVSDWQDLILVNMLGQRFFDETGGQFTSNDVGDLNPYVQGSWRNVEQVKFSPHNFLNAALAGVGETRNGGGPIWAIFDAEGAKRQGWDTRPPNVDVKNGYFFQAETIGGLAGALARNPHQRLPMPPQALEETVARYNGFVAQGSDPDFGKPAPKHAIATGPFYAAWATPVLHDTRAGLRINAHGQVIDLRGRVIERLYSGGETAGGFSEHGLARAICQGLIAARHATGGSVG